MSLESFQMIQGVVFEQAVVDLDNKEEKELVAAVASKKIKIFRLVSTCKMQCKVVIRTGTGSDVLRRMFFGSDTGPYIEESHDLRWPIMTGNVGSSLQIYQSDLVANPVSDVIVSTYIQYRIE